MLTPPVSKFAARRTWSRRSSGALLVVVLLGAAVSGGRSALDAQTGPEGAHFRVNAGGNAVSGTPEWTADTAAAPSPYVHAAGAGTAAYTTPSAVDVSHPSLPAGTPAGVFQSERYDTGDGAEMQWSFPVAPGTYEVRLYFAEIWFDAPGSRVFDVTIEGEVVLAGYDIAADVGAFKGVRKAFVVTADSTIDVQFGRVLENPKVSAIEIVEVSQRPAEAAVSPAAVDFGAIAVGSSTTRTVQITNAGGPGDPAIGISSTTIVGTDASQFADNFSDGATMTLAPGQSTTITLTFAPTLNGASSATLEIAHSGVNSPSIVALTGSGSSATSGTWQTLAPAGTARHEISYVHHAGNFYLTGDRDYLLNEVYTAATNSWSTATPLPAEFHHAQGVELNSLIYYLGGLAGPFPDHVVPNVRIFNPGAGIWTEGTPMPAARARGGGGTAVSSGKLYVAGGLQDTTSGTGHDGLSVSLFDVYNPVAGTWTALPNMPRPRDHFHAAVVGTKFYAIGGRQGGIPDYLNAVIPEVDVYDFDSGTWSTLPPASNLPTPRAGVGVAGLGQEIIVIGGEGNGNAYDTVEAFSIATGAWRTLPSMPTARHGIQAAVCNGGIYVVGGALTQGGISFTNAHEVFFLGAPAPCGSGPPPPSDTAHRVNAGGPGVETTSAWSGDTTTAPSPFVNATASASNTYTSPVAVNVSHPSIPAGTPAGVFQSERWDPADGTEMQWSFPVEPGTYQVRLYFAEIWFTSPGERSFDVFVEGNLVLDNYDIVADAGAFTGVVKSFVVSADSAVNVAFQRVVENPKIGGIEIVPVTASPGETGGSPPSVVGFGKSTLPGIALDSPTSLQFGPDGRLYVGQQNGLVRIYSVQRNGPNSYAVSATETIASIQGVPNHDDDGQPNPDVNARLITGILVVGTPANPVIYVAHSDPRIGGGPQGEDLNLDTNSSMISRLTWTGSGWEHLDLVRGLPRSEENHATNGMQLDQANNILYVAMGGNTNKGAPSFNFAYLPEYAFSAAILSIDLSAIGNATYDLPTLDDETRPGNPDPGDPFGGNSGKNQAMIVPGGPVQVYASGLRNPYDLVITGSGRMYTIDNAGNAGWGDVPAGEGPAGTCTNEPNEPGTTSPDSLHFITGPGYYGGHPNPTRGNMANTFNPSNPQSPVSAANPIECDYREAGPENGALAVFTDSTNGLTEYTADNFGGAMKGNLILASFDGNVYRVQLNATGTTATQVGPLFSSVGMLPLDVVAQGPHAPFPGTIWVGLYGTSEILVFEPTDFDGSSSSCTGASDASLDEDQDGYSNKDEIDNGTNPCSAADVPPDADGDSISDLNDPDDDNDGIPDVMDVFPLDPFNGLATRLPVSYLWENDGSKPGGILNLGFTGLMIDGVSNYRTLYNPSLMTAGGAAGVLTVDQVSEGDAFESLNNQQYAFQLGVWANPADTGPFHVRTRILGPFAGLAPADGQSMGLFVGTGDQDNYAKIVVSGTNGGQIAFLSEVGGAAGAEVTTAVALPGPNYIDLYLLVDPASSTVQPSYSVTSGGVTGPQIMMAGPQPVPASWFTNPASGLAIGIISTSRGPGAVFPATWDFIQAIPQTSAPVPTAGVVYRVNAGGPPVAGSPEWTADNGAPSSSYVNAGAIGDNVYTTPAAVSSSHPTVPAGTPVGLFQNERWNPAEHPPMQWSFPVAPGTYEVRLYFAEIWFTGAGERVFNVTIEGNQVLSGYDIVADAGAFTGVMKTFTVAADASLDIAFGAVVDNPKISAIEIVQVSTAPPPAPPAGTLHRVNAGGPPVAGSPGWSADTGTSPSSYTNAAATGNATYIAPEAVSVSHPSLPAGTPAAVFQSERWDPEGGAEMQWSFPVTPGTYEVRLYFAEIWFTSSGDRVFNVAIEGAPVLTGYDIVGDVGAFTGVMKSFVVTADSSLDIALLRTIENPKISAIEIISR